MWSMASCPFISKVGDQEVSCFVTPGPHCMFLHHPNLRHMVNMRGRERETVKLSLPESSAVSAVQSRSRVASMRNAFAGGPEAPDASQRGRGLPGRVRLEIVCVQGKSRKLACPLLSALAGVAVRSSWQCINGVIIVPSWNSALWGWECALACRQLLAKYIRRLNPESLVRRTEWRSRGSWSKIARRQTVSPNCTAHHEKDGFAVRGIFIGMAERRGGWLL
jgi:hypothetical protein